MAEFLETTVDKFTFRVATDRLYHRDGLWLLQPREGARVRIGLTDFLQRRSGDLAFMTVKPVGTTLRAGEDLAEMETIKVNITLASPLSGSVVAVNDALEVSPEIVNHSPYTEGWLAEVEAAHWDAERPALLDPEAYFALMRLQAEEEAKKP